MQQLTAFRGTDIVARGEVGQIVAALQAQASAQHDERLAIYNDDTGGVMDIPWGENEAATLANIERHPLFAKVRVEKPKPSGPGRPKLGVVAREVTLLPRHWQWLGVQRGGASAALRRLVEAEMRKPDPAKQKRDLQAAAHRFLWDMAGNFATFEEVSRQLYRGDIETTRKLMAQWPADVRAYAETFLTKLEQIEG